MRNIIFDVKRCHTRIRGKVILITETYVISHCRGRHKGTSRSARPVAAHRYSRVTARLVKISVQNLSF